MRPLGVDLDGAVLAALLVVLADVQIADGSAHGCATCGDLLRQPFGDLRSEILGVELRNARHDPVQQHAGGSLVDVFCG